MQEGGVSNAWVGSMGLDGSMESACFAFLGEDVYLSHYILSYKYVHEFNCVLGNPSDFTKSKVFYVAREIS